jgi:DNA-binding CsgD family transcriptional regulator
MRAFDQPLFERKLQELVAHNARMFDVGRLRVREANFALSFAINEAYLMKIADTDIGVLRDSFVPAVDEACRDVQRSGGAEITSAFVREELVPRVLAAIDGRRAEIRQFLETLCILVVKPSNWSLPSVLAHLSREMADLKDGLKTRYDIEIGRLQSEESQSRAADGQAQTARKLSEAAADAPKGFDGLGQKQTDLSRYFDETDLTERQRERASMKYEYHLSTAEIARRLDLHRSTVEESLDAVNKKLYRDEKFKQALKRRAGRRGSHDESD